MVYYRKYRPQDLSQLIGQQAVAQTLQKAHLENKLAHAYLFCGPRGTGKTSTARILAKMINCESQSSAISNQSSGADVDSRSAESGKLKAESSIPCNTCPTCISITDGSSLDLIEVDAASNRGIDDIRALRENIRLAPNSAKKKVYIIDEVHMLSTEAFNALLKTLEEPPAHVVFVLATTELHKIPVTILSRVQKLEFKLANANDIKQALQRIIEAEKLEVEDEALDLIAQISEGSFRDAQKLLDQLASRSEKITQQLVESTLNVGSFDQITSLIKALSESDITTALAQINQLNDQGINLKEYANNLLEHLRALMLLQNGAESVVQNNFGQRRTKLLQELATSLSPYKTIQLIKLFQEAVEKMKNSFMPVMCLEVAIAQSNLKADAVITQVPVTVINAPTAKSTAIDPNKSLKAEIAEKPVLPLAPQSDGSDHEIKGYKDIMILQDKWTYILETVKPDNYSLEALLRSVRIASCEDSVVILEVPYSFHQRILEAPKNRTLLESVFSDVLQKSIKVGTALGQKPLNIEDVSNVEVAEDDDIIRLAAEIFTADNAS